jgi:hypothetical protein
MLGGISARTWNPLGWISDIADAWITGRWLTAHSQGYTSTSRHCPSYSSLVLQSALMTQFHNPSVIPKSVMLALKSLSWSLNSSAFYENPKVHYRVHKSPPLNSILKSTPLRPPSLIFVSILTSCPGLVLENVTFPPGFPNQILRALIASPVHAKCLTHLSFLACFYPSAGINKWHSAINIGLIINTNGLRIFETLNTPNLLGPATSSEICRE